MILMKNKISIVILLIFTSQVFADVRDANNQDIIALMKKGVPVIDIRRAEEWQDTGVIKQSHLITFFDNKGNHNIEEWLPKLKKIVNEDEPVIIICRSGKRSGMVSKFLDEDANYSNVYNASGGMLHWISSKNKIIKID